jgi:hypothetical protein
MSRRPRGQAVAPEVDPDQPPQPSLRHRTPLPNGRAVAGGLLVAVSALGVAAAHLASAPDPRRTYVVAAEPIVPGTVVDAAQLTTTRLDLTGAVDQRSFQDPAAIEGAVALDPIAPGELVQAGDLLVEGSEPGGEPRPEISVALARDRAVDGRLVAGDVVDLLATYGTGDSGSTQRIAHRSAVRAVTTDGDGGFAGGALVTITVALADDTELLAATHAARQDALTLVRSTGTAGAPDETYRPGGDLALEDDDATSDGRPA